ncbi:single-stranded DNA-binding protein [Burkholderia phage vB_BpP_HN03]
MFGNLNSQGTEAVKDSLGGGGFVIDTDAYPLTIKALYGGKSKHGSLFVQLIATKEDGKEYKETIYVTNQKGENFYTKDNKKYLLPGYILVNDLCKVVAGKELHEMDQEDKVFKVYDPDAKGEVPKNVPMLVEAVGAKFGALIQRYKEFKQVKNESTNQYEDTAETREGNNIEKVYDLDSKYTVVEATTGAESATFVDAWLEAKKGKVYDKTAGKTPKAGAGNNGAPPKAGQAAAGGARPSLFKKS